MKRRQFFRLGGGATLAFLINGTPIGTFAQTPLLQLLAKQTQVSGRVLVLIQLNGGNDGLNTVVPLDQYTNLAAARQNILIPEPQVLHLQGITGTGLHPAMTGIRDMFDNGLVNIVQGAGYANPNFSHFRATDIWNTGSDSDQYLNTGWLGRYLGESYSGYPAGFPNASMPDPLAVQIGTGISPVLQGSQVNMGLAIADINSFYNIVNGTVDPAPATPAGHELTFIRFISQQTQQYTNVIQAAAQKSTNLSTKYPASGRNSLGEQLKIVARLINGGLQTPVYVVSMGSFDTHSDQVAASDHSTGTHATLLGQLSTAVAAFYDDLELMGIAGRVAAMTISEFGRRIQSNASGGTDHGTTAPVMVFGPGVNPGIIGTNPAISSRVTDSDNLALQHDYRQVYAAVISDWFSVPPAVMDKILLKPYTVLPVFRSAAGVPRAGGDPGQLGQCIPNPVRGSAAIPFASGGGALTIRLYDANGRFIRTLAEGTYSRGQHQVPFLRETLPPGIYFYRITEQNASTTRQMLVVD